MVKHSMTFRVCAATAVAVLALSITACGDKKDHKENKKDTSMSSRTTRPFGDECSAVPKTGKGSFDGMSADPVATAASNNPVLSTLVTAVQKADLAAKLNGLPNITVFAPTNGAFKKVPAADLQKLLANKAELTKVLTYHVVGQRITPDKLGSAGPFKTLQGGEITVSGSGSDFTVNGNAKVVCGGVQTANATVYMIDSLLMPASEPSAPMPAPTP